VERSREIRTKVPNEDEKPGDQIVCAWEDQTDDGRKKIPVRKILIRGERRAASVSKNHEQPRQAFRPTKKIIKRGT